MVGRGGITAEARQKGGADVRAEGPGYGRINVVVVVGAVDPADGGVIPGRPVRGSCPEFLDDDRVRRGGGRGVRDVGVPLRPTRRVALAGINVGGIKHAVSRTRVRQVVGGQAGQVEGPVEPPGHHDVVGARIAHRGQEGLQSGGVEAARRSPVAPDRPGHVMGFVVNVEKHRGVVGVSGGHRGPKGHGVHVGHVLLGGGTSPPAAAGGRSRGGGSRPVQVQVQVNIVVGAIIDDGLDHGAVSRLVGGAVGVGTTEPVILVDGKAHDIAMPHVHGFGDDRYVIGHGDAADGRGGTARPGVARGTVLQAGNIHAFQAYRAAAADRDDLVAGDFKLRGRSPSGGRGEG